ncbi:hypothetical protein P7L66_01585 (plasmid) [Tistrella mobilis]|uniref:hypothetical protein n=1 Tax=Tistrella mobilis TaxID=171437 RepID=UPI003558F6D1
MAKRVVDEMAIALTVIRDLPFSVGASHSLIATGDLITLPSRELTHVARTWFGTPNDKQLATLAMTNDLGKMPNLIISANAATDF